MELPFPAQTLFMVAEGWKAIVDGRIYGGQQAFQRRSLPSPCCAGQNLQTVSFSLNKQSEVLSIRMCSSDRKLQASDSLDRGKLLPAMDSASAEEEEGRRRRGISN
jgi:hypothetical protein